jgi:hypothetical protein
VLHYHGGGERGDTFAALFDDAALKDRFQFVSDGVGAKHIVVYGEAYGGKQQKNQWRYGPNLKFVVFEVQLDGVWQNVPEAHKIADWLGLEFVYYKRISTKLSEIDAERDAISEQAIRNGVTTRDGEFIRREGVVLRCIEEKVDGRGNRIIAKHKRPEERETKTTREVKPEKAELIKGARLVAEEFVTPGRIENAKSHFSSDEWAITNMKNLIVYILEDVNREGSGEFQPGPEVNKEVCRRAAQLIKADLENVLSKDVDMLDNIRLLQSAIDYLKEGNP